MEFATARPDAVRAVNQRWLLKFWQGRRDARKLPKWQTAVADNLTAVADHLSLLDVVRNEQTVRYLVRFHGVVIARVYGSVDHCGKFLDELIPNKHHAEGVAPYKQTVDGRCPVYTIYDLKDRNGRQVHYERLLLPFAADGETVDRILASFEFICPDGAFESRDLMRSQTTAPALRMAATIKIDAPDAGR